MLLKSGDLVYIPDNERQGTIIEEFSTRSYTVQTPEGTYRRNHRDLVPLPSTENNSEANDPPDTLPDGFVSKSSYADAQVGWSSSGTPQ